MIILTFEQQSIQENHVLKGTTIKGKNRLPIDCLSTVPYLEEQSDQGPCLLSLVNHSLETKMD